MVDCFNKSCPFRNNETSNPNRCESTLCQNRCGYDTIVITSNKTLTEEDIKRMQSQIMEWEDIHGL